MYDTRSSEESDSQVVDGGVSQNPDLPFPIDEFRRRLVNTQVAMDQQNFDLLIVTDPCNMNYLSGYDAWSFYVDQALLVPVVGNPVWVGREMDRPAAKATTWLSDGDLVAYGDHLVQSPDHHPMDAVVDEMLQRGWTRGNIGLELDSYFFTPRARDVLVSQLSTEVAVADASYLIRWLRAIKSPAELTKMSDAAKLVQGAMTSALDLVGPEERQADVVAEIYRQLIGGEGEFAGEYTSTPPLVAVGDRSAAPHLTWTDGRFIAGQPTTLELVASRHRYHVPLARTIFVGHPPRGFQRAAEGAAKVLSETIDRIDPGITCDDVARIWNERASRVDMTKTSRLGYSIGISYPPTFGERTLSVRSGDFTVIKENMTLHLIPGIGVGDWGLVISEPIAITSDGATTLCSVPRRLFATDAPAPQASEGSP